MFKMYVDESGDPGLINSPTRYFILTGVVIHELRWQTYLNQITDFKRRMKTKYGLHIRDEIHAAHFISKPGDLARIQRRHRLHILRHFLDELRTMTELNIINVVIDKQGKGSTYDVFEKAWQVLIQRFENTVTHRNFRGPLNSDERGCLYPDATDPKKLTKLMRKMRSYNPIPSQSGHSTSFRNLRLQNIIEDPNFRDSRDSHFIQAADVIAYFVYQKLQPNHYIKKQNAQDYLDLIDPILCKHASRTDPMGIVRL